MQWSVRYPLCVIAVLTICLIRTSAISIRASDGDEDPSIKSSTAKEDSYNRMICENEKLQIDCKKPDHLIHIERAYYGRYSIAPCNKYHVKYPKHSIGCTANDTLSVLRRLCGGRSSCTHKITNHLFAADPCPGVGKVLEINYVCLPRPAKPNGPVKEPAETTLASTTTVSTTTPPSTEMPLAVIDVVSILDEETTSSSTTVKTSTRKVSQSKTATTTRPKSTKTSATTARTTTTTIQTTTPPTTPLPVQETSHLSRADEARTTSATLSEYSINNYGQFSDVGSTDSEVPSVPGVTDERDTSVEAKLPTRTPQYETKVYCALGSSGLSVQANQYLNISCSIENKYYIGHKIMFCQPDGNFELINSSCARMPTEWLESYEVELNHQKDKKNTIGLIKNMNNDLKSDLTNALHSDQFISSVINFINNASNYFYEDSFNRSHFIEASNTIINSADIIISKNLRWNELSDEQKSRSITEMFDVVERVLFDERINYNDSDEDNYYQDENVQFNSKKTNIVAEVSSNSESKGALVFPLNKALSSDDTVYLTLSNPRPEQKFMFIVYKNVGDLLSIEDSNEKEYTIGTTEDQENAIPARAGKQIVNSNVISFKMSEETDLADLRKEPVKFTFKHLLESQEGESDEADSQNNGARYLINPRCVFWEYDKNTFLGKWSTDGCKVVNTNRTHTKCECNHLTHFAVLMDVHEIHQNGYQDVHQKILSWITIVCSIISCICIIFTLMAFRFVKIIKKNRENSTTKDLTVITTHLCVCLLLALLTFLGGSFIHRFRFKVVCSMIAMTSHYLFLCSFFWMLLEGVQLYLMLVRIFKLDKSPITKFCVIAYGIPFLIVLASKLVDQFVLDSKGYGTANHCWLSSNHNFNLTFIVPVSCILVSNFIILGIVIYGMRNSMSKQVQINRNKKQEDYFKSLLGFWCIILTLLGLPWILGYLMIDKNKYIVFSYLFTLVNSLQGTVVFVFHCIVSKSVREELLKLLRKQRRRFLSNVGSSLSSNSRSPMFAGGLNRDNHNNNNHPHGAKQAVANPALRLSSNSSSLPRLSKKMSISSSSKQVDRKNSNCSSSRNNSIYNNMSDQRLFKSKGLNGANSKTFSLLSYCYKLVRPLNAKMPIADYAGINISAMNKSTSSSSSFQDQALNELGMANRGDQSPFHNYVHAHVATPSHIGGKSGHENDEACSKLLAKDHYYSTKDKKSVFGHNTLRHNLINIQSQLLAGKDQEKVLTLNKACGPQMYFNPETASSSTLVYSDNEIAKILNSITNNKDGTSRLLTNAIQNMRRASSQISGSSSSAASSNNPTQSTYIQSSSPLYDASSPTGDHSAKTAASNAYTTKVVIAAPTEPPPLPPSSTLTKSSPSSSTNSKKDTSSSASSSGSTSSTFNNANSNYHNGNFTEAVRFSTFKCSSGNSHASDSKSHQSTYNSLFNKKSQIPSIIETPIISTVNPLTSVKKHGNYDENQYLTPEYHSYSMVESECPSESQYYCEDGGMGIEDNISNNYVEVLDEFDDPDISDLANSHYAMSLNRKAHYSSARGSSGNNNHNNNSRISAKLAAINNKYKNIKLQDLITMPEDFDREESMNNSNSSDQDLFNMTSVMMRRKQLRAKNADVVKVPSLSTSSSSSTASSSTDSNSTLEYGTGQNQLTNQLFLAPDENSKAKKILQRF